MVSHRERRRSSGVSLEEAPDRGVHAALGGIDGLEVKTTPRELVGFDSEDHHTSHCLCDAVWSPACNLPFRPDRVVRT